MKALLLVMLGSGLFFSMAVAEEQDQTDLDNRARTISQQSMIVDTHIDVPYRIGKEWADVTRATEDGEFDYERARQGGLDIPFMSIYTPAKCEKEGGCFALANRLIDSVEAMVGRAPDRMSIVRDSAEAGQAFSQGMMGLALGMENGSPIEGKIENVRFFRDRGVSYITLAHSLSNHLSDSSYDEERPWKGLSPFGREVVAEMNRLGMMVDVSHLSDDAFWQVLEISPVPVVATHSSARHFTLGFERNMSDDMIRALAEKGGVIMINFGSGFLTSEARAWRDAMQEAKDAWLEESGIDEDSEEASAFQKRYREKHPYPYADLEDAVAHFEHVIKLVGVEHVGIGSDYDGVGDSLPVGLKDVSTFPNLVRAFLELGYSNADIDAILAGNLMRVWQEVDAYAHGQTSESSG